MGKTGITFVFLNWLNETVMRGNYDIMNGYILKANMLYLFLTDSSSSDTVKVSLQIQFLDLFDGAIANYNNKILFPQHTTCYLDSTFF